jgi:hypothetical protein
MIYYIDESYVRNNLPVEYSLLTGNIIPSLNQAHLINARDLTGDLLFNKLNEMIQDGSINNTSNSNYKFLLDTYLTDVVLYWTAVYLTTNLLAKMANRGLQLENSEISSPADLGVYRTLKTEFTDLASYYSQRAKDWLYWNSNLFPEYQYIMYNGLQPANPKDKYNAGGMVLGQGMRWSENNRCWY